MLYRKAKQRIICEESNLYYSLTRTLSNILNFHPKDALQYVYFPESKVLLIEEKKHIGRHL